MKTIPLRQLVREPLKVKRWTRAGQTVAVTDNGQPLWVIQAAAPDGLPPRRELEIDDILDEVLAEAPSGTSAVDLLEDSRR